MLLQWLVGEVLFWNSKQLPISERGPVCSFLWSSCQWSHSFSKCNVLNQNTLDKIFLSLSLFVCVCMCCMRTHDTNEPLCWFRVASEDPNIGSHSCVAGARPTDSSPRLLFFEVHIRLFSVCLKGCATITMSNLRISLSPAKETKQLDTHYFPQPCNH